MKKQIRNLIFDMGNVLIAFLPEIFIEREGITDPEEKEILLAEIFRSKEWPMMDSGELTNEAMAEIILPRIPEKLRGAAENLILHWMEPLIPVEGMKAVLESCSKAGYRLFLLSNAGYDQPTYWPKVPGHELFEGTVVSAFEKKVKPCSEIYMTVLERFGLKAEECLFIDDSLPNVQGAEKVGITGYHFEGDSAKLMQYILE